MCTKSPKHKADAKLSTDAILSAGIKYDNAVNYFLARHNASYWELYCENTDILTLTVNTWYTPMTANE